jgi:hypothetical protein
VLKVNLNGLRDEIDTVTPDEGEQKSCAQGKDNDSRRCGRHDSRRCDRHVALLLIEGIVRLPSVEPEERGRPGRADGLVEPDGWGHGTVLARVSNHRADGFSVQSFA